LGSVELLILGAEESSNEQIDLFFQQLDFLSLPLFIGFKLSDAPVFLSKEFLKCNFLWHC
jgi:hypothetical protein